MTLRRPLVPVALAACLVLAGCGDTGDDASETPVAASAPSGPTGSTSLPPDPAKAAELVSVPFQDVPGSESDMAELEAGTGPVLEAGMTATFTYVIYHENGAVLEDSNAVGSAVTLRGMGGAHISRFLNEVLIGMNQGGVRRLRVAAAAFYPEGLEPPGAGREGNVILEVRLASVQPPPAPMVFPVVSRLKLSKNESGLRWADIEIGTGREVKEGGSVIVEHVGWLENGTQFETSFGTGSPTIVRHVGFSSSIEGWNEGLIGMKAGGRRVLVVPPKLAYGDEGHPPDIPPGATLVFMIDAIQVKEW